MNKSNFNPPKNRCKFLDLTMIFLKNMSVPEPKNSPKIYFLKQEWEAVNNLKTDTSIEMEEVNMRRPLSIPSKTH